MNTTDDINYAEMTLEGINAKALKDLNTLLPQLSSSAMPITQEWLRELLSGGTKLFTAHVNEEDGQKRIVGTVLLCTTLLLVGRKDWIEDVVVDNDFRRLGIASRLMDMAEQFSRERGAKSLNLTSNPDRGGARKMYEDRGYTLRDTGVFRLSF